MPAWSTEELQRYGYTLLTVYRDDEVIGSLTFPEKDAQITVWKNWIASLNPNGNTAALK